MVEGFIGGFDGVGLVEDVVFGQGDLRIVLICENLFGYRGDVALCVLADVDVSRVDLVFIVEKSASTAAGGLARVLDGDRLRCP